MAVNIQSSVPACRNRREFWTRLTAALFIVLGLASSAAQAPRTEDGAWWLSVSSDQRTGFLAGYIDCAVYDAGERQFAAASWISMEPKISSYYASHPASLDRPVASILPEFAGKSPDSKPAGGDDFSERHGIFDGEYWRQATPDHRVGYLRGYLACESERRDPKPGFPRNVNWYVQQISAWYGIKRDDPGAINAKRAGRKIADVLYLFRTTSSTAKP
jgi:hypothetical protein